MRATSPFFELVFAHAPFSALQLKQSLFALYEMQKPTLRLKNDDVYIDDVPYETDDDDDGAPIAAIDPDGLKSFITELKQLNVPPYIILKDFGLKMPKVFKDEELWPFFDYLVDELRECRFPRMRNQQISTFESAVRCFKYARHIVFLLGAGISVASGIPDFRSENGIYNNLSKYQLQKPTDMFSLPFFKTNPLPFYRFVPEIMPSDKYKPTFTHYFIKYLQQNGQIQRIYTQNIDCLEMAAGIDYSQVLSCHGSFATASCMRCKRKYSYYQYSKYMGENQIPLCPECCKELSYHQIDQDDSQTQNGAPEKPYSYHFTAQTDPLQIPDFILKPDIVFFGEKLNDQLSDCIDVDLLNCDLLVVIGSSLKVKPIAGLVGAMPRQVPQILINKERIIGQHEFDVELLGDCQSALGRISEALGFDQVIKDKYHCSYQEATLNRVIGHDYIYKVVEKEK